MRVAALYDIHGNLPALEAVLADVRRAAVDRIVVGGDVVPGPFVRESLTTLLTLRIPIDCIQGNGEIAVLDCLNGGDLSGLPEQAREPVRSSADELQPADRRAIERWPKTIRLSLPDLGRVLFCHATPRNEHEIFTRLTAEERLLPVFESVEADLVVCGHTHMQFDRTIGATRVVNAGSVGMPFGEAGAYWMLVGSDVELKRTVYDLSSAAVRIKGTRYPAAAEFAERYVLRPPGEAEMLAVFSKSELK